MSDSLIDSLIAGVQPDVIAAASAKLGVPRPETAHGLQTSVAAIGAGLAKKTDDPSAIRQVFDLATGASHDVTGAPDAPDAADTPGAKLLHLLFGNNVNAVASPIAQAAGVRPELATTLLGMAAPIVLRVLGSHVRDAGLSAPAFNTWLAGHRDSLLRAAPPALRGVPDAALKGRSSARWLTPAIAAVLAIGILSYIARRGPRQTTEARADAVSADTVSGDVARSATTADSGAGVSVDRRLPNGAVLHVPAGGTESKLLAYLDDASRPASDTVWFEFDRLLFDQNGATLSAESSSQLTDIATILAAYPTVHATIGGYTDNTGDAGANLKLSQARARSVVAQLTARGIASDRLTAKGYGEAHPVADNASATGRARNRRVALRITQR